MEVFLSSLRELEESGAAAIAAAAAPEELERVRVEYLGRKARLTQLLRGVRELPEEQRPEAGAEANRVKNRLLELLDQRASQLAAAPAAAAPGTDLTLPGRGRWRGARHPCTLVADEICDIFKELGFVRARGPEAETTWYNFTALNTPLDHPAADEQDTFYLAEDIVLRTHTSPVQTRVMEKWKPPVRIVVPGVVYRRDPFDASHAPAFEQIEGLAVDEGISFVEFKASISYFVRRFFGEDTATRFRPSFFPFTEPSAEVDVSCLLCHGEGCSACKGTGWIEIMGAGMVDPAVFDNVGYDSERYTGFAFGMGVGRIAMLRYRIPDIRLLYESDVRFLEQFERA
ncbi:MAG: phenylalanine--tRNA ligase subunit alpha [Gemmatimonadota bacterium]|nr:MAG: phenylalanine--tRNA ligase subunit alpha [Gemmatimonadota bacterium]